MHYEIEEDVEFGPPRTAEPPPSEEEPEFVDQTVESETKVEAPPPPPPPPPVIEEIPNAYHLTVIEEEPADGNTS